MRQKKEYKMTREKINFRFAAALYTCAVCIAIVSGSLFGDTKRDNTDHAAKMYSQPSDEDASEWGEWQPLMC